MRRWVRIWVNESLTGTIRFDFSPAERGIWYELILLGGYCKMEGFIGAGEHQPFPDEYIAGMLNVPLDLFQTTINKCLKTGRIEKNGSGYKIVNWGKYQSEYERQKPYRQKKKQEDPDKYKDQKYGHMVARSAEDVKHYKEEKKRRQEFRNDMETNNKTEVNKDD